MSPAVGQFEFRRLNDAVQVSGYHPNERLVARLGIADAKVFQQVPNVVLVAM